MGVSWEKVGCKKNKKMNSLEKLTIFKNEVQKYPKLFWPSVYRFYADTTIMNKSEEGPVKPDAPEQPEKPGCLANMFGFTANYQKKVTDYNDEIQVYHQKCKVYNEFQDSRKQLVEETMYPENHQRKHLKNLRK